MALGGGSGLRELGQEPSTPLEWLRSGEGGFGNQWVKQVREQGGEELAGPRRETVLASALA
eukprot:15477789-Alexandrium_andersonii.AAC.1